MGAWAPRGVGQEKVMGWPRQGTFPPLPLQLVTHPWHQITYPWESPLGLLHWEDPALAACKPPGREPASFSSGCACFSHPGRSKSCLLFISVIPPLQIKQKKVNDVISPSLLPRSWNRPGRSFPGLQWLAACGTATWQVAKIFLPEVRGGVVCFPLFFVCGIYFFFFFSSFFFLFRRVGDCFVPFSSSPPPKMGWNLTSWLFISDALRKAEW